MVSTDVLQVVWFYIGMKCRSIVTWQCIAERDKLGFQAPNLSPVENQLCPILMYFLENKKKMIFLN